jgi:hypothetical protein
MRRTAAFLTLAVALLLPASAEAIIQVDRGIAGARVNNTKAQVRAALGTPAKVVNGTNEFGTYTQYRYRGGITVTFQGGTRVSAVATTGLGDRTARGVGVRSRESTVVAKVPNVTCQTIAGTRECHTGEALPGQRTTSFLLAAGRVTRVTVGIVID